MIKAKPHKKHLFKTSPDKERKPFSTLLCYTDLKNICFKSKCIVLSSGEMHRWTLVFKGDGQPTFQRTDQGRGPKCINHKNATIPNCIDHKDVTFPLHSLCFYKKYPKAIIGFNFLWDVEVEQI